MKAVTAGRLLGALAAVGLFATVLVLADPAAVLRALEPVRGGALVLAFAAAAAGVAARGLRLLFLLPAGRLGPLRATAVAAAALIAAMVLPARLGELTLPWLLKRSAGWPLAAGVATLVAARVLDLATLGLWAGVGLVMACGVDQPLLLAAAALLAAPAIVLPATLGLVERSAGALAARAGGRWASLAARVGQVVTAGRQLRQAPARVAAAAACSLLTWGTIWLSTWWLLAALGFAWPLDRVVAGAAVASLASVLPLNLVANLGTLEAGWTAAFAWLGVPLDVAAASGVACHLWSLLFAAVLGGLGWGWVTLVARGERC